MPSTRVFSTPMPRRRLLALAAATATATLSPWSIRANRASAEEAPALVRATLPNGLVVLVQERAFADTVALQLSARAGSRDDGDLAGVTVVTSRMFVQGTTRRPSETALQRAAVVVGTSLQRGTSTELSQFSIVVPASNVDVGFDLLSDIVVDPLFDAAVLTRQQQVALQDLAQRRSNPSILLGDLFQATILAGNPGASPVLGTPESLQAITPAALAANRARLWGASNLVLTVVGRITADAALAMAQQFFGALPAGTLNQRTAAPLAPLASPQQLTAAAGQQQAQILLGYIAPSLVDPDRFPFIVLTALTSGGTGRLFREIRTRRGLAYSAGSGYSALTDVGYWGASAGVDPQNVEQVIGLIKAEIQRLRDAPPAAGELRGLSEGLAGAQIVGSELNAAVAGRLSVQEILGDVSTQAFVERVVQVTPADIQRVARAYLDPDRALQIVVGPPPA